MKFVDIENLEHFWDLAKDYIAQADSDVITQIGNVFTFKGNVATTSDLPSSDNTKGDVYVVEDGPLAYTWNGSAWMEISLGDIIIPATDSQIDAIFA